LEMAVPIEDEVRFNPPLRRCHQLCFAAGA
jgi:hypothetical protein